MEPDVSQAVCFNNVLSEQGVFFDEKGICHIRLDLSPSLQTVEISLLSGESYPLAFKENAWQGAFRLPEGFQYIVLKANGADVLSPWLPIGYGACRPINYIEVPAKDSAFYQPKDVPRGTVTHEFFLSSLTGRLESCLVYLPPAFDVNEKYPILYLQHGYGENETGWVYQGRMNRILDSLIAEKKAVPMIVVMCCGMVQLNGEYNTEIFPQVLIQDVIPFIESKYPVRGDKWNRAMAGLSMGSMHTSVATLTHPELFGYAGLFSGFLRFIWKEEQPHLKALDDPEQFAKDYRVFFRAMGTGDEFFHVFLEDDAILEQKGIHSIDRRTYDGKHEWQVWRKCLRDFLPLLFQENH